jgi:hypothetical protein
MKKLITILLLSSAVGAFSQQIGLSLGTAMITGGSSGPNPKNICGHFQYSFSEDVKLNLSAGYSYERAFTSLCKDNILQYYVTKLRILGVPIEMDLQCSKPLVILSGIRAFIGLGLGYYHYSIKYATNDEGMMLEDNSNIKGFGQYFTFGLDYRMGKVITTFIQFKKMGFNTIKTNDPYEYDKPYSRENSYNTQPGLNDLSMTIGILFNLRPRNELSINIQ